MTDGKKPLKLFIFDNNGTALDDLETVAYPSVRQIFEAFLLPVPSLDEYRNEIGADFFKFYLKHGFDELSYVTGDDLNKIRKRFYAVNRFNASYRPDFVPLIMELKRRGIRVAMCSAEIPEVLFGFLDRAGLLDQLDGDLIRAGAWPEKGPHLSQLVADLGLDPQEAVYVDDTEDGISAANGAGLKSIGFTHPTAYNSKGRILAANPTHTVESFTELQSHLDGIIRGYY